MIGHQVPRHWGFMFPRRSGNARLRASGVRGTLPCPPEGAQGGPSPPPGTQEGLGGRRPPNSIPRQTQNLSFCQVNFVAGCRQRWRWDGSFSLYALLLLFAIVLGNCTGATLRAKCRWEKCMKFIKSRCTSGAHNYAISFRSNKL